MYSGRAVVLVVAVPGRKIDAELQPVLAAGVGDLPHHVALAVLPRAVLHRVLGVLARPEAEAVVVLAGEDQPAHAGLLGRADDLVGVEVGGIEDFLRLVAVAPFLVGEGVDGEVQEAVDLQVVPAELPRAGHGAIGLRRVGRVRRGAGKEENKNGNKIASSVRHGN